MLKARQLVRLLVVAAGLLFQAPSGPIAVTTVAIGTGLGAGCGSGDDCPTCCACAYQCTHCSGSGTSSSSACLDCDRQCAQLASSTGCGSCTVTSAGPCK